MKSIKNWFYIFLIAIFTSSCAKIFYSPDAKILAQSHKAIAIIPPTVSIEARKKVDAEALREQQKTESLNFQKEMYAWMLKRKMQGKISPEILDIETTNAKLKKSGYPETPLSPVELAEILDVDGVLSSNFSLSKPISEGAAVALGLILGAYGPTNEVKVSFSIHDRNTKKLIWNFDHKYSGSLGSTPARMVDGIMRNVSKRMPYKK